PAILGLEHRQGLRPGVCLGDRRYDRSAQGAQDLTEIGVSGVLVEDEKRHRTVLAERCDRLVSEGRIREITKDDVGRVRTGPGQGALAWLAEFHNQAEGLSTSP